MRVCVVRLGAYGDCIQITPIFRELKKQGHHVTFYCQSYGKEVVSHDPNIDKFVIHDGSVPIDELFKYLDEKIAPQYDKLINLSSVVEKGLLVLDNSDDYYMKHRDRRAKFGSINYSDALLEKAGLDIRGQNPELYFTNLEERLAKKVRNEHKNKFMILWSLSGSGYHKVYPYSEYVAEALYKYPDIVILTVGDELCEILEWKNSRTRNYSGKWPIRKSMIMTKYADCVVGTETGVLNAASAYDTPKVILLSHSSEDNLTKYWRNTTSLSSGDYCQPCHSLVKSRMQCEREPGLGTPICMAHIHSKDVFNAIMENYMKWRQKWEASYSGVSVHTTKKMEGSMMAH
jgi:ADP-heptose:LPS heptosyltransferase